MSSTYYELEKQNHSLIRFLDHIQVKGKSILVSIFEVLNGDTDSVKEKKLLITKDFEKDVTLCYLKQFDQAQAWFAKCLEVFPDDLASQLDLERCKTKEKEHSAAIWTQLHSTMLKIHL